MDPSKKKSGLGASFSPPESFQRATHFYSPQKLGGRSKVPACLPLSKLSSTTSYHFLQAHFLVKGSEGGEKEDLWGRAPSSTPPPLPILPLKDSKTDAPGPSIRLDKQQGIREGKQKIVYKFANSRQVPNFLNLLLLSTMHNFKPLIYVCTDTA